jgi:hypothetical protein
LSETPDEDDHQEDQGVDDRRLSKLILKEWQHLITETLRDGRLEPRLNNVIPSSGLLRGVCWFKTDVSGLPISPNFKGHASLG